tara:strand:- start:700 stop:918 length:219 start_codon:yes stop_codon:yes gene_type:complete
MTLAGNFDQCPAHALHFLDAALNLLDMALRQLLNPRTGAVLVLPQVQEITNVFNVEPKVARPLDKLQGFHVR